MPIPDWIFPNRTGTPDQERLDASRTVPFAAMPDGALINNIVHGWMNPTSPPSHPREVFTWGEPNSQYTLRGLSNKRKIGIEASRLAALLNNVQNPVVSYPEAAGTLANELTHYHQDSDAMYRYDWMRNNALNQNIFGYGRTELPPYRAGFDRGTELPLLAPRQPNWVEINRRRERGEYDDSPWLFKGDGEAIGIRSGPELESTLNAYAMRNYMQALQEERYRQRIAPDLRPR